MLALSVLPVEAQLPFEPAQPGEWFETDGGRVRLVLGSADSEGRVDGAIEIDLDEGWKTYWIAPGPSGIPPQFDASRSTNLVLESIEYPAPTEFNDVYGMSVGYKTDVSFPVSFTMPEPDGAAEAVVEGFLGICAEICIPVQVSFAGPVTTGQSTPFELNEQLRLSRLALPVKGSPDGLSAALEDERIVLSGPALANEASEIFVASGTGAAFGDLIRAEGRIEVPVLRGDATGDVVVVVKDGARATQFVVSVS